METISVPRVNDGENRRSRPNSSALDDLRKRLYLARRIATPGSTLNRVAKAIQRGMLADPDRTYATADILRIAKRDGYDQGQVGQALLCMTCGNALVKVRRGQYRLPNAGLIRD